MCGLRHFAGAEKREPLGALWPEAVRTGHRQLLNLKPATNPLNPPCGRVPGARVTDSGHKKLTAGHEGASKPETLSPKP